MMCYGGLEYVYTYTTLYVQCTLKRGMKSHYAITSSQVSFATSAAILDVIRRRGITVTNPEIARTTRCSPGDSHCARSNRLSSHSPPYFSSSLSLLLFVALWLKEAEWFHESKISYASLSKAASMRWNYVCWCAAAAFLVVPLYFVHSVWKLPINSRTHVEGRLWCLQCFGPIFKFPSGNAFWPHAWKRFEKRLFEDCLLIQMW